MSNTPPYTRLEGIGTRECAPWREAILTKHWPIMGVLVHRYLAITKAQDYIAANTWLGQTHERLRLGQTSLWLHSDNDALRQYCDAKAKAWQREIFSLRDTLGDGDLMLTAIQQQVIRLGVTFPVLPEHPSKKQKAGALARIIDPQWLRRQLRVKQGRELEALLRELGVISKYKGIYVSDFSLKRRGEQKPSCRKIVTKAPFLHSDSFLFRTDINVNKP